MGKLDVYKEYILREDIETVKLKLQKHSKSRGRKFIYKQDRNRPNSFRIFAKTSLGTAQYENGRSAAGISVYGRFKINVDKKTVLILETKMRGEVFLLCIASIVFFIVLLFNTDELPFWLLFIPPVLPVWFFYVYRIQELALVEKVEKILKIKPYQSK